MKIIIKFEKVLIRMNLEYNSYLWKNKNCNLLSTRIFQ